MMAITTSVELGHATAMTPATSDATPYATIQPQAFPSRPSIAVISPPRVISMGFLLVSPNGQHRDPLFRPGRRVRFSHTTGFKRTLRTRTRSSVRRPLWHGHRKPAIEFRTVVGGTGF